MMTQPSSSLAFTAMPRSAARARRPGSTSSVICLRSTGSGMRRMPSSRRLRSSSFSVVRCRRSDAVRMSETNSRMVSGSICRVFRMLSDIRRMEASGVFSSCEASETKRLRCFSFSSRHSVRVLNSRSSSLISSLPVISCR